MTASSETRRLREKRAGAALALKDKGISRQEIARHLGISPHTVNGYFTDPDGSKGRAYRAAQSGTCRLCGAKTSRAQNELCVNCVPKGAGPSTRWTPESIIAAIRAWNMTYGKPPSYLDWSPKRSDHERRARYRRLHAGHRQNVRPGLIPSGRTVVENFGTWNAAMEAAGFVPKIPGGQKREPRAVCESGHALEGDNLYVAPDGSRRCRRCHRIYRRRYKARQRGLKRGLLLG